MRQQKIKVYQFRTSNEATLIFLILLVHQKHSTKRRARKYKSRDAYRFFLIYQNQKQKRLKQ